MPNKAATSSECTEFRTKTNRINFTDEHATQLAFPASGDGAQTKRHSLRRNKHAFASLQDKSAVFGGSEFLPSLPIPLLLTQINPWDNFKQTDLEFCDSGMGINQRQLPLRRETRYYVPIVGCHSIYCRLCNFKWLRVPHNADSRTLFKLPQSYTAKMSSFKPFCD